MRSSWLRRFFLPTSTSIEEDGDLNFGDDAWDEKYFLLILELSEKNASRYESQANSLLENKCFEYSLNGVDILYKLTPTGCSYYTSENAHGVKESSWSRMGWTKSSKARALPFFFAKSEASVLID